MIGRLLVLLLVLLTGPVSAQVGTSPAGEPGELVILKRSDQLEGLQSGTEQIRKLTGNVYLQHKNMEMYCDRAIQNLTTNVIEAYGNVRMIQGDTVSVRGDTLFYYGASRQANVTGRTVILKDRKMTLTTRRLEYDMANGIAYYPQKGRIVDRENVLTSKQGYYNTRTKVFTFRDDVRLVNPKYTLTADSLLYNSLSKVATFQGPTRITSKEGTLIAKDGDYNTVTRFSNFQRRATIETEKYTLTGDTLLGNNASDFYTARGNVVLFAKNDKTILTGDFGRYNRKVGVARMIGHALVKSITSSDTLFMRADTLWSFDLPNPKWRKGVTKVDSTYRRLIGQKNVLVFKNDLQSKCDSIVYETADSTIYFFGDPIVWSTNYQMEGDSITALMKNNRINKMLLRGHSFVISQDTLQNFNQVKGRTLTAFFGYDRKKDRSDIDHVVVEGNGESLYFAVDEANKMIGMNRVLCSKMTIRFADRKVKKISFYGQPDSKLIPPKELKDSDKQLDGFNWRVAERPTKAKVTGYTDPVVSPSVISSKTPGSKPSATAPPDAAATTRRDVPGGESKLKNLIRKTPVTTSESKAEKESVKPAVETKPLVSIPAKTAQPSDSVGTLKPAPVKAKSVQSTTPVVSEESELEKELNRKPVRKTGN